MYCHEDFAKFKDLIYFGADHLEDGIVIVDASGICLYYNDAAKKFFGQRVYSFMTPEDEKLAWITYGSDGATVLDKVELPVSRALAGEKLENISIFMKHMDSEAGSWLLVSGGPVYIPEENFSGAILIYRDKTSLKKNEFELELLLEKLKQSNLAKDSLMKMLAHDLLNPISAITGLAHVISEDTDDEEIKEVAKTIMECSESLREMTLETLKATIEKSTEKDKFEILDLDEIAFHSLAIANHLANQKSIRIKSDIVKTIKVHGDSRSLKRTFEDLITNAIKFSDTNSQIEVSLSKKDGNSIFKVSDKGMGIKEDILPELFAGKIENCRLGTSGEKSTGLGLPFVKDVVESHNGIISVESIEGEGTTFTIKIPTC